MVRKPKTIDMKKLFLVFFFIAVFVTPTTLVKSQDNKLPILTAPEIKVSIPEMERFQNIECKEGTCNIPWLGQYIAGLQNYAIGIVGVIAVIALMIGGIVWLTAAGNNHRIEEAKKIIGGSVVGVMLVLSAYSILYLVNPSLTILKGLEVSPISKVDLPELLVAILKADSLTPDQAGILNKLDSEGIIQHVSGASKDSYREQSCNQSVFSGGQPIEFYTTGYYKPGPWENSLKFFCAVGLNCTCPSGYTKDTACGGSNTKCNYFSATTPYCNKNASGTEPQVGEVAADLGCFNRGDKLCLQGPGGKKTVIVADAGGWIKGRRLDIFTGNNLNAALTSTGVTKVTLGACQ